MQICSKTHNPLRGRNKKTTHFKSAKRKSSDPENLEFFSSQLLYFCISKLEIISLMLVSCYKECNNQTHYKYIGVTTMTLGSTRERKDVTQVTADGGVLVMDTDPE